MKFSTCFTNRQRLSKSYVPQKLVLKQGQFRTSIKSQEPLIMLFNAIIVRLIVHASGNGPITMKLMPQKMDHTGLVLSLITFYKLLQAQMTQQLRMINLLMMIILALPHLQILATMSSQKLRIAQNATITKSKIRTIASMVLTLFPNPLVKSDYGK